MISLVKLYSNQSIVELCVFSFNRNAFLEHPQFIQSPFILALREAWIIVVYGAGMVTISYLRLSHCEPRYKQIEEETNKKTFSIDDHGKLITDGDYQNIFRQGRMREADIKLETDMNYNQDDVRIIPHVQYWRWPTHHRSSLGLDHL